MRQPVIGVMGGANASAQSEALARELGALIARRGWVLLNGGRNQGVMSASAEGAKRSGGTVIGILPDHDDRQASEHLDYAIITGLSDARNLINILSSDVVIACPGSAGTLSEVALALKNQKRVILLGLSVGGAFDDFRASGQLTDANDPEDALRQAEHTIKQRRAEP